MTKEELKQALIETEEYTEEEVNNMDSYDLLDAILTWEGIQGYTHQIIRWAKAAYESDKQSS